MAGESNEKKTPLSRVKNWYQRVKSDKSNPKASATLAETINLILVFMTCR